MSQQDTHELKDGFYWVRWDGCWSLAEKICERFYTIWDGARTVSELDEIDPRPIVRPE